MTVDWHENCWNFCHLEMPHTQHTHIHEKSHKNYFHSTNNIAQKKKKILKKINKVVPCELAFFANLSCGIAAFTATDNNTKHEIPNKNFLFISLNFLFTCTH